MTRESASSSALPCCPAGKSTSGVVAELLAAISQRATPRSGRARRGTSQGGASLADLAGEIAQHVLAQPGFCGEQHAERLGAERERAAGRDGHPGGHCGQAARTLALSMTQGPDISG